MRLITTTAAITALFSFSNGRLAATPATLVFEDQFDDGLPGWTAVQPVNGAYIDGPMMWCYDKANNRFFEDSNIYTDASTFSSSRITTMLINDTVASASSGFTFTARMAQTDDDAFGLIWGYEGEDTFYRIQFATQSRALGGWPAQGMWVDRMLNSQPIDVFGPDSTFIPTRGVWFDVTLAVTNDQLRITITNDPLGAATVFTFNTDVTPITMPTTPNGRVGLFTWGQSSATVIGTVNLRSFSIQNPTLSPTPLSGAGGSGATTLTNWTFGITPAGTTLPLPSAPLPVGYTGIQPDWSYGITASGFRGTLMNMDDQAPNNSAPFTTNFIAATAVAGDTSWSNYVYSARFICSDNDGFGMLLRYQDETNFYRISFRNQNAQTGIKRGMHVQKNINSVFEEIYTNASAGFIPPYVLNSKLVYEVHASIRTNRLQIIALKNPDTTPTAIGSDQIDMDITPGTVDAGKIGVFSWAQRGDTGTDYPTGTEVDWVKVSEVAGEGMIVSSGFGNPSPDVGLHDFPLNSLITATNDLIVSISTGVRQTNTGFTGVGSLPASGFSNRVDFLLTNLTALNWRYQLQYLLTTTAEPGGSVSATLGPWINANANVTVTATPSAGYMFGGWSGNTLIRSNAIRFPMVRPVTLHAKFLVDSDGDALPDLWEYQYFGNLAQTGSGDPDSDGVNNAGEYVLGRNPAVAEALISSDGFTSQWTNTSRDPGLPGEYRVQELDTGYRGAFNNNNEFRYANDTVGSATYPGTTSTMPANNYGDNGSFQTGRMIVRSNAWNTSWGTNFSASWEVSVGDNDGECFYFRYINESNWFRVSICGEDPQASLVRPFVGMSIQMRTNGIHTNLPFASVTGSTFAAINDPLDGGGTPAGFKKIRITVSATNQMFEIKATGWDAFLSPSPDFNPAYEGIWTFTNATPLLHGGRIGFANWGQGGFGAFNAVNGIPIGNGGFFDNITVKSPAHGSVVFSENFESVPLYTNYPSGWTNVYEANPLLVGNWVMNVDGVLSQLSNQGMGTSGTTAAPAADGDAPIMLAPDQVSQNYTLQIGFHQFDNDGVGFVYDFVDTNNFSRVIFRQEATIDGDVPIGLSVSRKTNGVWTDIVSGDPAFLFVPGRPFEMLFSANSGDYTLLVRDLDTPILTTLSNRWWHWTGPTNAAVNRFGVTTWASQSAHVLYARAFSLPVTAPVTPVAGPLSITNITVAGGTVTLGIQRTPGIPYHVLRATDVLGPYVTNAAYRVSGQYTEPEVPGATLFYRLQLAQ